MQQGTKVAVGNVLEELQKAGQSIWLDYIRRNLITCGELKRLVDAGLRGVTSNPTIFEKAIAGSTDYDEALRRTLNSNPNLDTAALYESLTIEDIQMAADVLRPVYDATGGADGFVSFEVSPDLAYDTLGTISEARRLWKKIGRPNVMIKVPATDAGIFAIETLIGEGVNVNVTLMFSLAHYEAVAQAYVRGIEKNKNPKGVASVASFFVSRVDTMVDRQLEQNGSPEALAMRGKTGIANCRNVYRRFEEIFESARFKKLAEKGAKVQRPLWASTGTKNPAYSDVLYVNELIGAHTVNTVPPATLEAFRDHGTVKEMLKSNLTDAQKVLAKVQALGVDLEAVTATLQQQGVELFANSYKQLLQALEEKRRKLLDNRLDPQRLNLGRYQAAVEKRLAEWEAAGFGKRLWEKDYTLWANDPAEITNRLGWLTLPDVMTEQAEDLSKFVQEARAEGFEDVVLLGMGGSSLAPEVFEGTFSYSPGYPALTVLDSTHPDAVRAVEKNVHLERALFIVSSKSGTTIEPNSFLKYFWARVGQKTKDAGKHFVAITDPGTAMVKEAKARGFRRIFEAVPDVGGRYSALTHFGLVPAALIGVNVDRFLSIAGRMSEACAAVVAVRSNPGLALGVALGELARAGRDKVTFITSGSFALLPAWLEQLIAESTGKDDKGIVPVAGEPVGSPAVYSSDRVFVYVCAARDADAEQEAKLKTLEAAGHPVIRIEAAEIMDLGQEFFRWEVAIAAAGAVIGIQPFNQPDVELAKNLARQAMAGQSQAVAGAEPVPASDAAALRKGVEGWLGGAKPGNYISIHAYLAPKPSTTVALESLQKTLRDKTLLATTLGYGPRFLHSTGQLHKGGPNTGLFVQFVDEPADPLAVPETDYSFGQLIKAQALGDYQALTQRGRRVLRVQLGKDAAAGLRLFEMALTA